jgi:hypothetical protein
LPVFIPSGDKHRARDGDSAKPVTESRAVQVPFLNNKCGSE